MILEKIYASSTEADLEKEIWTTHLPEYVSEARPNQDKLRPPIRVETSLGNLARLGLVTTAMTWTGISIFSCVYRTFLGYEFLKAISRQANDV